MSDILGGFMVGLLIGLMVCLIPDDLEYNFDIVYAQEKCKEYGELHFIVDNVFSEDLIHCNDGTIILYLVELNKIRNDYYDKKKKEHFNVE